MREKLIVALDLGTAAEARELTRTLEGLVSYYKVGMQLYNACGPGIVTWLKKAGFKVFLDLKFHDIPNTVAEACAVACRQGVDMLNMHLSGGSEMVRAAVQKVRRQPGAQPLLLGVTVLTSLTPETLSRELGVRAGLPEQVVNLALLGRREGLDGVVASAQEITLLRRACGVDFVIVTPGIRPRWAHSDDQRRVMTPGEALQAGADYLVVGRPVTAHADPRAAARDILQEMEAAV